MKITLYDHQTQALARVQGHDRVLLAHGMGSGKTIEGIELLRQWGEMVNIIVCQASLVTYWVEECKKYCPEFEVFSLREKKDTQIFLRSLGYVRCIAVINYDLIWRREELAPKTFAGIRYTMIFDESSLIQHIQSKRSKKCISMICAKGGATHAVLLSGTPMNGRYENLFYCAKILCGMTKKEFYEHYIITRQQRTSWGGAVDVVDGYKNIDELKATLKAAGADFLKTEDVVRSLPAEVETTYHVETEKLYRRFMKDRVVDFTNADGNDMQYVGDTPLLRLLYARMLSTVAHSKGKAQLLTDILESTGESVIIFYSFEMEYEALRTICEAAGRKVYAVNGKTRQDADFKKETGGAVLLVQYQAGSMGLNLQVCRICIYASPPLSVEYFEQSKARVRRIGQTADSCLYYYLQCAGVESDIYETLARRHDYNVSLFEETHK